jgi:hypothetical protein
MHARKLIAGLALIGAFGTASADSVPKEQRFTRAELEAKLDCTALPEGADCTCVADEAMKANVKPINLIEPRNAPAEFKARNRENIKAIRISLAIKAGKSACGVAVETPADEPSTPSDPSNN